MEGLIKVKRIIYKILIMCIVSLLMTGCVKDNTGAEEGYAYITIDASSAGKGVVLSDYEVNFTEGSTVFDITFTACKDNGILMSSIGIGAGRYVEGIADLYEFDFGPASGWVFYVNGDSSSKSSGVYEIKQGDVIKWEYVIE